MDKLSQTEAVNVVAYLNRAGLLLAMEGQAAVWQDALWGVKYADAVEACRTLAREPLRNGRFVTPADVLGAVRRLRAGRIRDRVAPAPPVPLPPAIEKLFGQTYVRALGDGATEEQADELACSTVGVVRALESGSTRPVREVLANFAGARKMDVATKPRGV